MKHSTIPYSKRFHKKFAEFSQFLGSSWSFVIDLIILIFDLDIMHISSNLIDFFHEWSWMSKSYNSSDMMQKIEKTYKRGLSIYYFLCCYWLYFTFILLFNIPISTSALLSGLPSALIMARTRLAVLRFWFLTLESCVSYWILCTKRFKRNSLVFSRRSQPFSKKYLSTHTSSLSLQKNNNKKR